MSTVEWIHHWRLPRSETFFFLLKSLWMQDVMGRRTGGGPSSASRPFLVDNEYYVVAQSPSFSPLLNWFLSENEVGSSSEHRQEQQLVPLLFASNREGGTRLRVRGPAPRPARLAEAIPMVKKYRLTLTYIYTCIYSQPTAIARSLKIQNMKTGTVLVLYIYERQRD